MKKRIPPFIVTSNVFLFFPMAAAIYAKEWFYFLFAVLMFMASAGFHYTFYYNKKSFSLSRFLLRKLKYSSQKFFQITDWTLAALGSVYVINYIYESSATFNLKVLFAVLFLSSLIFFVCTFVLGNYNKYHPWFHVFTQILLGFIVLML